MNRDEIICHCMGITRGEIEDAIKAELLEETGLIADKIEIKARKVASSAGCVSETCTLAIAHIKDKKCPAGECKAMTQVTIDPEKCKGCSLCSKNCPVGAIHGELKSPFEIDQDKCIKCGVCIAKCPFKAISKQ